MSNPVVTRGSATQRVAAVVVRPRLPWLRGVVLLTAAYFLAAQAGYALDVAGPVAAVLWLPAGVGIAFLALGGLQLWPGMLVGDLLVNDYSALPLGAALGQTCGNLLEVLVGAWLIRRLAARRPPLGSVSALVRLGLAIATATAISATVGVAAQLLAGVVSADEAAGVWRTWWLGDAAGAVVVVPLALAWSRPPPREWWHGRAPEALLVLAVILAVSELAFRSSRPLTYLVFPVLIWAALRFAQRGATLAIAVVVGVSAWHTAHYAGPFVFSSITHGVLATQLFILAAAATTLALAAVVSERESFAKGLNASRARLVDAAEQERRRLEHNLHDGAQQRLTGLGVQLRLAREQVRTDPERADASLDQAESQLGHAVDELRELAHGIHPAVLTRRGLPGAIESIAARSAIPIEVIALPSLRPDAGVEATAYYVVAETVTNAQKHSKASSIRVRGTVVRGVLHIEVADDGVGGAGEDRGSGLQGLRDRVEAIGGTFAVHSIAGRGTRVVAAMPAGQVTTGRANGPTATS